jgi:hypothetical protein
MELLGELNQVMNSYTSVCFCHPWNDKSLVSAWVTKETILPSADSLQWYYSSFGQNMWSSCRNDMISQNTSSEPCFAITKIVLSKYQPLVPHYISTFSSLTIHLLLNASRSKGDMLPRSFKYNTLIVSQFAWKFSRHNLRALA